MGERHGIRLGDHRKRHTETVRQALRAHVDVGSGVHDDQRHGAGVGDRPERHVHPVEVVSDRCRVEDDGEAPLRRRPRVDTCPQDDVTNRRVETACPGR